jgi:hypothetical protein
MDRINSRIAQTYGYAVCFITVIVMLISIKSVVDAVFDLSDPIRADAGGYSRTGRSLSNFDVYKLDAKRDPRPPSPVGTTSARPDTVSDAELRRLYEAEREQAIGNVQFRAKRTLVGSGLLIIVAVILFVIHWRWLKERDA